MQESTRFLTSFIFAKEWPEGAIEAEEESMKEIKITNETDYDLPPCVLNQILSDAIEYFGDSIHTIRIQSGIERHTYNAKTCEVRFAFFSSDYDFNQMPFTSSQEYQDQTHYTNNNEAYNGYFPSEFDDDDDEGILAVIDDELEGITTDDDLDLKILDTDLDSIDTSDFEY